LGDYKLVLYFVYKMSEILLTILIEVLGATVIDTAAKKLEPWLPKIYVLMFVIEFIVVYWAGLHVDPVTLLIK
jgi:hypothetical protein